MLPHKSKTLTRTALLIAAAAILLAGCADSPEEKAAKELRRLTEEAIKIAEKGPSVSTDQENPGITDAADVYANARKTLQTALAKASIAGDAAAPAWLAHGNLCFAQVRHMRQQISQFTSPVSDVVDELTVLAGKITELHVRREKLLQAADTIANETRQLTDLLEGTPDLQGLKAKLAHARTQLNDLAAQREKWLADQQNAQQNAGNIQRQADEKLQAAQLTAGDQKMNLLNEAFELMRQKKQPFIQAQEAADQVKLLDQQIAILRPTVQQLEKQSDATAKRIAELTDSPELEKINSGSAEVDDHLQKHAARVDWLAADLKKGLQACAAHVAQMTELLDTAISDYKKVRARSLSQVANVRTADANAWKASIAADQIIFNQHVSGRLQAIAAGRLGNISDVLNNLAEQYFKIPQDDANAIMQAYDEAITAYAAAPASDKSAKDVMATHVLALYGKALFAERLGDYDAADAAINAADELLEKVKQLDPVFFTSVTAQLLNPSAEFIPPMSVDLSATYEEFKKQFQAWKQLRGDEKKAEVERLLNVLNTMKPPLDPQEFERIIGPERQALEAQLARGFDEPASDGLGDPNYMF